MAEGRYRDTRYLKFLRNFKGKFCFVIDSLDFFQRWFFQKLSSRKKIEADNNKYLHILCIKRDDYVIPALNCVNSFWQFHPEFKVKIWCDALRKELLWKNLKKFHRSDRIEFQIINPKRNWQEDKLHIICNELLPQHIFSDADIFWNGRITISNTPLFFLREYDFDEVSTTKRLKKLLKLDASKTWFMLNVSVVNLGLLSNNRNLFSRARQLLEFILEIEDDKSLGSREIIQLHRTCEQLAISIAIQEMGDFECIKYSDYLLDGGIIESFYLGATKGF